MKRIFVILLLSLVVLPMLVSCDQFLSVQIPENPTEGLNKGEVGNQDIWITDWEESACYYSGCKATYTLKQGEPLPYLWLAISGRAQKAVMVEPIVKEGESLIGSPLHITLLRPDKRNVTAVNLISYPSYKMDWIGERVLTWRIRIIKEMGNPNEVLEEHFLSVKMVGVE